MRCDWALYGCTAALLGRLAAASYQETSERDIEGRLSRENPTRKGAQVNILAEPFKALVTGPSGSGKSTYVERFLRRSLYRKAFIFDHNSEFETRLKKLCCVCDSAAALSAAARSHYRFIAFNPYGMFGGDIDAACEWFCHYVLAASMALKGKKLIVIDEAQRFVTPHELPTSLRDVLELGRKYDLHAVLCAHGANTLGPVLRNQITEVVAFRTKDDNAINFLKSAGLDKDAVRNLDAPGGYMVQCLRTGRHATGHLFKQIAPAEASPADSPTPSGNDGAVLAALD